MEKIISIKDERVVHARLLATSKGRNEHHECLLEGEEQIIWALDNNCSISLIFIHDKIESSEIFTIATHRDIPVYAVSDGILKKITDTNYLVPIVGVASTVRSKPKKMTDFVVVLDNVIDQGNVGAIVRSAKAFGVYEVAATSITADFFYKKTIDASRGTIFGVNIYKCASAEDTVHMLKKHGYQIVVTSPHAQQLQSLVTLKDAPIALVLGNETKGCSDVFMNSADVAVQMPMSSAVESLNVAVAAGISIYELQVKLVIAMLIQKIHKKIGRQLSVTTQLIHQALDYELKKVTDISAMQLILLMVLKCDEVMTLDQVTRDIGEHGAALEQFLKPLVGHNFIQYVAGQQDRIQLTRAGEEAIAKLWPITERAEQQVLHGMSETEVAQLKQFLTRIQSNCMEMANKN